MGNASFVQTSFLGGEWSPRAQGRMADPAYKSAMNVCLNAYPTEEGMWTRRPGFRFLAHTYGGQQARIMGFDFTVTQPYQIEFTNLKARLFAGLSLITTLPTDGSVAISAVANANPAVVYLSSAVPAGWANGDTIVFRQTSLVCSCPALLNRQFVIGSLDTSARTLVLHDPFTGATVDATTYGYTRVAEGEPADTIEKIFELTTVFTTAMLPMLRLVTDDDTALVLTGQTAPYLLAQATPWALTKQAFKDGPWLDINKTTTTLTPSGTSGTFDVAASAVTGINSGRGFLSTDVGRLIRIQMGPTTWSNATTYAKDVLVTGSDMNVYNSVAGSNLNHDPTTDDGTHWIVSSATASWSWMIINSVANSLQVNVTLQQNTDGTTAALPAAVPVTTWRLGLYSDTTGWPSCGVFHEGRLWLASTAFGNRVDGSVSNDDFNFSPTAPDGTVANDNAVAAIAKAKDVNYFFWMLSTEDGLILGAQAGEWRIRASSLDDPISPSSIQMRRVSNWGCANIEPVQTSSLPVFVQRLKRKLLAHLQVSDQKYAAENLSHLSDHLISSGVEEIRWQQEPPLTLWSRCADGSLSGLVFQKGYNTWQRSGQPEDSFGAAFSNSLGDGRVIESLSDGPTFDGASETIYVVTNQTNPMAPDYNVRWVQTLMPVFDSSQAGWQAQFVDGSPNDIRVQQRAISNGDAFDGVSVFGLWHKNAGTVAPVINGLDLGDRLVSNGQVDIPYLSDPDKEFTASFVSSAVNIAPFGQYGASYQQIVVAPTYGTPVASNSLLALVGDDTAVTGSSNFPALLNTASNRVIEIQTGTTTNNGARILSGVTGAELLQAAPTSTFPTLTGDAWSSAITYRYGALVVGTNGHLYQSINTSGTNINKDPTLSFPFSWEDLGTSPVQPDWAACQIAYLHCNGYIYAQWGSTICSPMFKVNATTLICEAIVGARDPFAVGSGYNDPLSSVPSLMFSNISYAGPRAKRADGTFANFLVYAGQTSANIHNQITVLDADLMKFLAANMTDEHMASVCSGPAHSNVGTYYAVGYPSALDFLGSVYTVGLYVGNIGNVDGTPSVSQVGIRKVLPADIDATWNTFSEIDGPAYDASDGGILVYFQTADVVTNKYYMAKFSPISGNILWKTALPGSFSLTPYSMSITPVNGTFVLIDAAGAGTHTAYILNTTSGALSSQVISSGLSTTKYFWDQTTSSVTFYGDFTPPGSPVVSYLGAWLPAHSDTLSNQWGRYYLGLPLNTVFKCELPSATQQVPAVVGTSFTSRGQLLRPDFGPDAGAQNGPAFGKLRRIHKFAILLWRSRGAGLGTIFGKLHPLALKSPGKAPVAAPALYSGIISDTLQGDDTFEAQIAWEITRPYPLNIPAVGGYIATQDK